MFGVKFTLNSLLFRLPKPEPYTTVNTKLRLAVSMDQISSYGETQRTAGDPYSYLSGGVGGSLRATGRDGHSKKTTNEKDN